MLRRLAIGLACAVVGYIVCAFAGGMAIQALSSNRYDRETEAAMTGAFVIGPLGAIVAFFAGAVWLGRRTKRDSA